MREIKLYEVAQIFSEPLYKIDINSHRGDSLAFEQDKIRFPETAVVLASYTDQLMMPGHLHAP